MRCPFVLTCPKGSLLGSSQQHPTGRGTATLKGVGGPVPMFMVNSPPLVVGDTVARLRVRNLSALSLKKRDEFGELHPNGRGFGCSPSGF